jgi:predicted nucleic acid-binding protein
LILIDQVQLLGTIYGHVIVPPAVVAELQRDRTPEKVRAWIAHPPQWFEMKTVNAGPDLLFRLGAGEQEALILAEQFQGYLLLVDERKAAKIARERGILVMGTLGVLEEGARRNLADLQVAIGRLREETNFRATPELYEAILERERRRREASLNQNEDD